MGLSGACIIFENYKYLMGGVLKLINKKKISMKQIQFIQRCKCGAITIKFSDGASNSMFLETFEGLDLDISRVV